MHHKYVHGYTEFENNRLSDQAKTLDALLHYDTHFPESSTVLELGCGVGAQTEILCRKNPSIGLTSIDISPDSLQQAESRCRAQGFRNVVFQQADLYKMPFAEQSFDHVFICFVLEHLPDVDRALQIIKSVIRPGGSIIVIEGDHGSAYFYPESTLAQKAINCLVELQALDGGDSLIGRSLYPLLARHQFIDIRVSPRMVYADNSLPEMVDGFTRKTFIAMVEGVKEKVLSSNMMSLKDWDRGIDELKKTSLKDGVFCYTFFKAQALVKS